MSLRSPSLITPEPAGQPPTQAVLAHPRVAWRCFSRAHGQPVPGAVAAAPPAGLLSALAAPLWAQAVAHHAAGAPTEVATSESAITGLEPDQPLSLDLEWLGPRQCVVRCRQARAEVGRVNWTWGP